MTISYYTKSFSIHGYFLTGELMPWSWVFALQTENTVFPGVSYFNPFSFILQGSDLLGAFPTWWQLMLCPLKSYRL